MLLSKLMDLLGELGTKGGKSVLETMWPLLSRLLAGSIVVSLAEVEAAIRPKDAHSIQTALICLENTHNAGGGTIYPLSTIERIRAVASAHGVPMHLDGARLFNAVAATTLPPSPVVSCLLA